MAYILLFGPNKEETLQKLDKDFVGLEALENGFLDNIALEKISSVKLRNQIHFPLHFGQIHTSKVFYPKFPENLNRQNLCGKVNLDVVLLSDCGKNMIIPIGKNLELEPVLKDYKQKLENFIPTARKQVNFEDVPSSFISGGIVMPLRLNATPIYIMSDSFYPINLHYHVGDKVDYKAGYSYFEKLIGLFTF